MACRVSDDDEERVPLMESISSNDEDKDTRQTSGVQLERHITLPYAVAIMAGNVIGSGIFVSPKGVTANIGSVGGSLLVWAATGLLNLGQALCYCELGTMMPQAGGDYNYLYQSLGPLPAFMCVWIHILVLASCSCAVIARTAGLYLVEPFGLNQGAAITVVALWLILTLAATNAWSAKWGTRVQAVFTAAKFLALSFIIIMGIVQLAKRYTRNYEPTRVFEGTTTDAGSIALAVLDGYFAYKGWELLMALPEEMVNPARDLPRATWISMILVTTFYVLTNASYFTVLSAVDMVASDAVAISFAEKTIGVAKWIMSICVFLSCTGTVNSNFLANSRYLFAGGRYEQIPKYFAMLHIRKMTPLPAVVLLCVLSMVYCVFKDLQQLQEYTSLAAQFKVVLTLVALFYLRWKSPDVHRPYKVNILLAILVMLVMLCVIVFSFYKNPLTSGIGAAVFALGLPAYGVVKFCQNSQRANRISKKATILLQKITLVAPESAKNS